MKLADSPVDEMINAINTCIDATKSSMGDDDDNPAALPQQSTEFLLALAKGINALKVFEFGSGKSTKAFLSAGLTLTSIEDSQSWMDKTISEIPQEDKRKLTFLVQDLSISWAAGFPTMDWRLNDEIRQSLASADLVLIDSPLYTGFRESTLVQALKTCTSSVIVLDDVRIPAIAGFCQRISAQNPGLFFRIAPIGHTMAVFYNPSPKNLQNRLSLLDRLKGWRRFLNYRRFGK